MSNQQSDDPIVLVGPVEELHITIPFENDRPLRPKSIENELVAATFRITLGTAVSAGRLEASCT